MGLFSGIGKAIKGAVGAVGDVLSPVTSLVSGVMGVASPFMERDSVSSANAANVALSREQMDFQRESNRERMNWESEQAGRQIEFQREMSDSAYRRGVIDMRAAGLNPMLAYSQGGASTPGGAAGSGASSAGSLARVEPSFRAASVQSAAQASVLNAQVNNVKADTANKIATAQQIVAQTELLRSQTQTEGYKPGLVANQAYKAGQEADLVKRSMSDVIDKIRAEVAHTNASAEQLRSSRVLMKSLMNNPVTAPFAPLLDLIFRGK